MYIRLGRLGHKLMAAPNPRVEIRYPIREEATPRSATKKIPKPSLTDGDEGSWLSTKNRKPSAASGKKKTAKKKKGQNEIIELDSDDEKPRARKRLKKYKDDFLDDDESEAEFD